MKKIISIIAVIVACAPLSAQSLKINKSEKAQQALSEVAAIRRPTVAMGYRVGIFFDNSQDARSKAYEAKTLFEKSFKGEPVHISYESPYYKVSAGDCFSQDEAIMLFERVREVFPSAYVMREKIKISQLVMKYDRLDVDEAQMIEQDSLQVTYTHEEEELH